MGMANFGGQLFLMQVTSMLDTFRMIKDTVEGHITLPTETSSLENGDRVSSMVWAIKHSPMATCWMEAGVEEGDMESSSLCFPMEQDIRLNTTMESEKEGGQR